MRRCLVVVVAAAALSACAGDGDDGASGTTGATTTTATATTAVTSSTATVTEPELRSELLAMMAEDQAEQTGQQATNNSTARTTRLAAILDRYGWPSIALVGEDGSTAAWVIAQHADLDLDLQRRALALLRVAAEDGQASRGDLAYLTDRVAVATGADQSFGTQMRCGEDEVPVPATPIADAATVDARRAEAGLAPLQDYVVEMTAVCAADG